MAYRLHVLVCTCTACAGHGSLDLLDAFQEEIKKRDLGSEVLVVPTGCCGMLGQSPIVVVKPEGIFYAKVRLADVPKMVEEHFLKGRIYKNKLYTPPEKKEPIPLMSQIPFFQDQMLIVMRNRGLIDPEKIEDAIARDGYQALAKVLTTMTPEQVIAEIHRSGLRGRGGGGFPVGVKWKSSREAQGEKHYVICNADEGDPGAFMDRSVIEGDPHAVIEGMCIGAFAVDSNEGYIYVRKEYPLAVRRFSIAIEQAREYGLLGKNILGTNFSFDIQVRRGAGAFVCGESTALMASVEGRAGEPRAKYIHTVEHGLWNQPTVLNNVETWANVPVIIMRGAKWFASIGTGDVSENPWNGSTGTKVFSLAGKVNNCGLLEVPMGISLRKIIFDIGGGIPGGKKFKAVQTGGPSGGFLPESCLDLAVDFDVLTEAGSMMGSGGMIIIDEDDCIVDMAKYFIEFLIDESCGKCVPCREGLRNMHRILERICLGLGQPEDVELLEEISSVTMNASLCALGGSAPNPVLSTIRYFSPEYETHIRELRCPSKTCRTLIIYMVEAEKCNGCTLCTRVCPVEGCITGALKELHKIHPELCIKCGACRAVCKPDAIYKADAIDILKDFRSRIGAQAA